MFFHIIQQLPTLVACEHSKKRNVYLPAFIIGCMSGSRLLLMNTFIGLKRKDDLYGRNMVCLFLSYPVNDMVVL